MVLFCTLQFYTVVYWNSQFSDWFFVSNNFFPPGFDQVVIVVVVVVVVVVVFVDVALVGCYCRRWCWWHRLHKVATDVRGRNETEYGETYQDHDLLLQGVQREKGEKRTLSSETENNVTEERKKKQRNDNKSKTIKICIGIGNNCGVRWRRKWQSFIVKDELTSITRKLVKLKNKSVRRLSELILVESLRISVQNTIN